MHKNSTEEDHGLSSNETELRLGNIYKDHQGFFSWADHATVDNTTIDVLEEPFMNVTDDESDLELGETSFRTFFSFISDSQGEIVWDPKVGVNAKISTPYTDSNSQPSTSSETTSAPDLSTTPISTNESQSPQDSSTSVPVEITSAPGFQIFSLLTVIGFVILFKLKRK